MDCGWYPETYVFVALLGALCLFIIACVIRGFATGDWTHMESQFNARERIRMSRVPYIDDADFFVPLPVTVPFATLEAEENPAPQSQPQPAAAGQSKKCPQCRQPFTTGETLGVIMPQLAAHRKADLEFDDRSCAIQYIMDGKLES